MIPHGSFWLVLPDLIMVSSLPYLEFLTTLSLLKVKEFMRHEMFLIDPFFIALCVGVISKGGSGGGAPLVKISAHFGGLSPPRILGLA